MSLDTFRPETDKILLGADTVRAKLRVLDLLEKYDVATTIRDIYSQTVNGTAQILKDAGYAADQVGKALKDVFTQVVKDAAQILKDVGYAAEDVIAVLPLAATEQPVFYGQTRFVLSPPLAVLCTATGRAASDTLPAPPSRMRAATRNASISAFKPEICAWKMAIWFSFSFIASYILVIV